MTVPPSHVIALPPAFLANMGAAAAVNLIAPWLFAIWARRRFHLRWAWIGIGALGFVLSQVVHIPLILIAKHFWLAGQVTAIIVFASVTAGLCEETARWILLRRAVPDRTFRGGFGYGVGHGGVEAFLLAGVGGVLTIVQVIALAKLDPSTLPVSADKLEAVRQAKDQVAQMVQAGALTPLLSVWERIWAVTLQLGLSLLVLRAVVRKNPGWWALAVAVHGAVDVASVLAMRRWGPFGAEGFITFFGLLSLAFIVYEWRRWRRAELAAAIT